MVNIIKYFHNRLVTKLILTVGLTLLLSISTWEISISITRKKSSWMKSSRGPTG